MKCENHFEQPTYQEIPRLFYTQNDNSFRVPKSPVLDPSPS